VASTETEHRPSGLKTARAAGWRELARNPIALQAARFLAVGGASYAVNISLYAAFVAAGMHYLLAAVSSYAIGFTFNFLANRHWTFAAGGEPLDRQLMKFSVLAAIILALDLGLLRIAIGGIGAPKVLAQAVVILLLAPVSFAGNRLWSFVPAQRQGR
jgi:putative flippase GtrA